MRPRSVERPFGTSLRHERGASACRQGERSKRPASVAAGWSARRFVHGPDRVSRLDLVLRGVYFYLFMFRACCIRLVVHNGGGIASAGGVNTGVGGGVARETDFVLR